MIQVEESSDERDTTVSDPIGGKYEQPHEKPCFRGFRPGPTQTELYSHRKWLET